MYYLFISIALVDLAESLFGPGLVLKTVDNSQHVVTTSKRSTRGLTFFLAVPEIKRSDLGLNLMLPHNKLC